VARIKVVARHQSGRWDEVDSSAFKRNVLIMRRDATIVTRTELTDQSSNTIMRGATLIKDANWRLFHPKFPGTTRYVDCGIEWDGDFWKLQDNGLRVLTDYRVTTAANNVQLLPSSMPWVLLESRLQANWTLLLSVAHNNLDNTPGRAAAWLEEGHTFQGFQERMRLKHRPVHRLHQADINKNLRNPKERLMVSRRMLGGTGLKWGYDLEQLPNRGTLQSGNSIIDYSCSNMSRRGRTLIMANTGFADHNPIETNWYDD
jgi:hypothetical protein